MKIAMIHGQDHKGSSYHIGRTLAEKMGTEDQITEFFLPRDLNHFCKGCYLCIKDVKSCPFYQDRHVIEESIEKADFLIFTTPAYCMGPSAPMKSLIDFTFTYWMPHRPRACMFKKKAVVIATAAGAGTKSAMKCIKNALFYWGIPYVKSYGITTQAMGWKDVSEEKKIKIEKDMSKLAKKMTNNKFPHVRMKTKFLFNIMRFMQRKEMGSDPAERQYWEDQGWLGKKRPWKSII